jgi:hypothetical protein
MAAAAASLWLAATLAAQDSAMSGTIKQGLKHLFLVCMFLGF